MFCMTAEQTLRPSVLGDIIICDVLYITGEQTLRPSVLGDIIICDVLYDR